MTNIESIIGQPKQDLLYVYFIEAFIGVFDTQVKIGYSKDPYSRLRSIEAGQSLRGDWLNDVGFADYSLLGVLEGGRLLEKTLHNKFSEHRVAGEWYWLEPIEEDIDTLLDNYCVCSSCLIADNLFISK